METTRRPNRRIEAIRDEYRMARLAWELAAEAATLGYATEMAEYRVLNPAPTYKMFLQGMTRTV